MSRSEDKWRGTIDAKRVKELVSGWAWSRGMWSIEEIGELCNGRLDMLLVPLNMDSPIFKAMSGHWTDRLGLIGVEVKVDKQDFKHGLESGQFDRYAESLSGLYIAGPPDVVVAKMVPEQYGVISVGGPQYGTKNPVEPIACRRHPHFVRRPLTEEATWRIVWSLAKDIGRFTRSERERAEKLEQKIKEHAGHAIAKSINSFRNAANA